MQSPSPSPPLRLSGHGSPPTPQEVDNQLPDIERLCQHRSLTITRRYVLSDVSASNGAHKEMLARMLADAHAGHFNVVVVWAADRLSRGGIEELLRIIRELRERNVALISVNEPWLSGSDATTSCSPRSPRGLPSRKANDAPSASRLVSLADAPRANRSAVPSLSAARTSASDARTATSQPGSVVKLPSSWAPPATSLCSWRANGQATARGARGDVCTRPTWRGVSLQACPRFPSMDRASHGRSGNGSRAPTRRPGRAAPWRPSQGDRPRRLTHACAQLEDRGGRR